MKKLIFILTLAFFITMSGCSKFPELGDGYRFDNDGKYTLQIVNSENTVMIRPHILEFAFDSTFIIVSHRPWDSVPNIKTISYKESNKAFEKSLFRQYWIINKKEKSEYNVDILSKLAHYSNVYGPFNKEKYLKKRQELGVPEELELKK